MKYYIYNKDGSKNFPPWPYDSKKKAEDVLMELVLIDSKRYKNCYIDKGK